MSPRMHEVLALLAGGAVIIERRLDGETSTIEMREGTHTTTQVINTRTIRALDDGNLITLSRPKYDPAGNMIGGVWHLNDNGWAALYATAPRELCDA